MNGKKCNKKICLNFIKKAFLNKNFDPKTPVV